MPKSAANLLLALRKLQSDLVQDALVLQPMYPDHPVYARLAEEPEFQELQRTFQEMEAAGVSNVPARPAALHAPLHAAVLAALHGALNSAAAAVPACSPAPSRTLLHASRCSPQAFDRLRPKTNPEELRKGQAAAARWMVASSIGMAGAASATVPGSTSSPITDQLAAIVEDYEEDAQVSSRDARMERIAARIQLEERRRAAAAPAYAGTSCADAAAAHGRLEEEAPPSMLLQLAQAAATEGMHGAAAVPHSPPPRRSRRTPAAAAQPPAAAAQPPGATMVPAAAAQPPAAAAQQPGASLVPAAQPPFLGGLGLGFRVLP